MSSRVVLVRNSNHHGALVRKWNKLPAEDNKSKRVAIDLIGLYNSSTAYRYSLTVMHHFSSFLKHNYPLQNKTSTAVIKELDRDLFVFGKPKVIVMDNGSEFSSHMFKEYCRDSNISQAYCLSESEASYLTRAVKVLNESVHTTLETSLFFAHFRYHPTREVGELELPEPEVEVDMPRRSVREVIQEALRRNTEKYWDLGNKNRKDKVLAVGDLVWIYNEEALLGTSVKFNPKWQGSFKIKVVMDGSRAYELGSLFEDR